MLAARRHDVASIRTVAGNLDHAYVNQIHRVDLMPESLNAIDVAASVSNIPQMNCVGFDDKVVTKQQSLRFIAQQKNSRCAVITEVKEDHQLG